MVVEKSCQCSAAPTLIFSCSGAADVGELSDRAARKMSRDGTGRMFCLTGIGGRVNSIMKSTEAAQAILAIDGCPSNCASQCLKEAGFTDFIPLQVADLGLVKCQSNITEEHINTIATKGCELLQGACG